MAAAMSGARLPPRYEDGALGHPEIGRDAYFFMVNDALQGTDQKHTESRLAAAVAVAWSAVMLYYAELPGAVKIAIVMAYVLIVTTVTDLSKTVRDNLQATNGTKYGIYDRTTAESIRGSSENATKVWITFLIAIGAFCAILFMHDISWLFKGSFFATGFFLIKAFFDLASTLRNRAEAALWREKYMAARP